MHLILIIPLCVTVDHGVIYRFNLFVSSGVEGRLIIKPKRTTFQTRLSDLSIEDLTENTLYTKVYNL